jgi:hypothetical protein
MAVTGLTARRRVLATLVLVAVQATHWPKIVYRSMPPHALHGMSGASYLFDFASLAMILFASAIGCCGLGTYFGVFGSRGGLGGLIGLGVFAGFDVFACH